MKLTAEQIYSIEVVGRHDNGLLSFAFGPGPDPMIAWVDYIVRDGETDDEWRELGYVPVENGWQFGIDAAIHENDLQRLKSNPKD